MKRWATRCLCFAVVLIGISLAVPLGTALDGAAAATTGTSTAMTAPEHASAQSSEASECAEEHTRSINEQAHPNSTQTGPIELTVRATDPVLNFGSARGIQADYIVLKASKPIPKHIFSTNFEIDSLEPMRRIGTESLESVRLVSPTYTRPHFFNHRKELGSTSASTPPTASPGPTPGSSCSSVLAKSPRRSSPRPRR